MLSPAVLTPAVLLGASLVGAGSTSAAAADSVLPSSSSLSTATAPSTADTIRGRLLRRADRSPIAGARIRLDQGPSQRATRSDSMGRFQFRSVDPGRYRLRVQASGYRPRDLWLTVPEEGAGRIEILLNARDTTERQRGTIVNGRVTEQKTGEPLADAFVEVEGTVLSTVTNASGSYRLEGVPPGPQMLRVQHIGYATARLPLNLLPGGRVNRPIELATRALEMEDITVTADAIGRAAGELGTASVIGKEAIDNTTAASVADLLELTPGVPVQPPGVGATRQFSLRSVPAPSGVSAPQAIAQGPSAADLASFGTSIILDGVPISNNANLQRLAPGGGLVSIPSTAGGGIDLRRIPAKTLERVEVIRGIPSVRYGDLTQGAVVVQTKAGAVIPELDAQLDPRTRSGAAVGGTGFGLGQTGTLAFDVTRTRISPSLRDEVGTRISGQLSHRAEIGSVPGTDEPHLLLDSRVDFFRLRQERPLRPEVSPGFASERENSGLRLNERLRLRLGRASRLDLTVALARSDQSTFQQRQAQPTATPVTTRKTSGRQRGQYLVGSYTTKVNLEGKPWNLFTRLQGETEGGWLGARHELRAGTVLRREWNDGSGLQFDMTAPPRIPFNGVQGFLRPRSFEPVPPLVGSAYYLDDRATWLFSDARLTAQAGLRADLLHKGSSWFSGVRDIVFQPRLNVEFAPVSGLRLRAGAGRMAKLPALSDLFPENQYYDLVNVNHFAEDPAERLTLITTRVRDPTNPDLGFSIGERAELSLEVDLAENAGLSVSVFRDRVEGGVGIGFEPDFLERERFAVRDTAPGTPPEVLRAPAAVDTVPILMRRPQNLLDLDSRGVELTAFLPEIKPIHTRFQVQGAWTESEFRRDGLDFGTRGLWSDFQLDPDDPRNPFWGAATGTGERAILTYRAVHRQPDLGLMIHAIVQHYPYESQQVEAATDTLAFEGFITREGELTRLPPEERGDPEFADLRRTRSGVLIRTTETPADWIMSLRVAKTLPLEGRLSLYAFNALNREGKDAGLASRIFPDVRFGVEARFPLTEVFR